jgi:hypothetical protein
MENGNLTLGDAPKNQGKRSKFPRWLMILIPLLMFVGICCVIGAIMVLGFSCRLEPVAYSIDQVILTSELDDKGYPVGSKSVFRPSERIICVVTTTGTDGGIVGMRWYYQDKLIFEQFGKTQNNMIGTYIQSNRSVVLEEGYYRVDILITGETPLKTVNFTVKRYVPSVEPLPTPTTHRSIELPLYTEVPFVFDEIWRIDDTDWQVNEVKIVILESGESLVTVLVNTDMKDLLSITKEEVKERARPIALYALQNGYLERARSYRIDGKYLSLDTYLGVTLVYQPDRSLYRVLFTMDELPNR